MSSLCLYSQRKKRKPQGIHKPARTYCTHTHTLSLSLSLSLSLPLPPLDHKTHIFTHTNIHTQACTYIGTYTHKLKHARKYPCTLILTRMYTHTHTHNVQNITTMKRLHNKYTRCTRVGGKTGAVQLMGQLQKVLKQDHGINIKVIYSGEQFGLTMRANIPALLATTQYYNCAMKKTHAGILSNHTHTHTHTNTHTHTHTVTWTHTVLRTASSSHPPAL